MQEIIASVENIKFDIEFALEQQLGTQPLPFSGMDKSGSAVCSFYMKTLCSKGAACPFRHVKGDRSVVCKHWLRGLCKKVDDCEFLHEYDMSKMPECYFFSKFGHCGNKECPFLHIDPETKIRDCPWYDRGFCRHGPQCKNRHVRRVMCQNYLNGFCLDGSSCKYVHAKFDLPALEAFQNKTSAYVCHICKETGHKAYQCPSNVTHPTQVSTSHDGFVGKRPIEEVQCYKCREMGHYANRCPKGPFAFLSSGNQNQSATTEQMTQNES